VRQSANVCLCVLGWCSLRRDEEGRREEMRRDETNTPGYERAVLDDDDFESGENEGVRGMH
jgi:hypothetical protein